MASSLPPMKQLGLQKRPVADAYHSLVRLSWPMLVVVLAASFVIYNSLFALLYLAGGDCIAAEDPDSFLLAFSFSVQTMTSTGYGAMHPTSSYAHIVSVVESFGGLVGTAIATGLMFAKFARPTARIEFSDHIVVCDYDGRPTLQFRVANQRATQVVEARIQVNALIDTQTEEGQSIRRLFQLKLIRDNSPAFRLSWLVIHPLDADSPVATLASRKLPENLVGLMVMLIGIDEGFSQTVHASAVYDPEDILFDHHFIDMIQGSIQDGLVIDHRRLHDTEPVG